MTKTFVFDLDGTLYDEKPAYPAALAAATELATELFGVSAEDFSAAVKRSMAWQFSGQVVLPSSHSRCIRFQRALEELGKPPSGGWALGRRYYDAFFATIAPRPGIDRLLQDLRARGARIGLGTNMSGDMQMAKVERLGLARHFDFIVSSEEANAEKPAAAFFDLVAEKSRCERSEILFCGDNLECDARGAAKAGMRGVWLRTNPAQKAGDAPDVESISSPDGLRKLVPEFFDQR